jgi:predicted DCC family thiol-disulfide oxidoreductase YuxK
VGAVQPHSYRADPAVPVFDDRAPLIIFDGHCVLCSAGVQWMMARDPAGRQRFAAIQSPLPRALYRHYGLDAETFDTFLVLKDGVPYTKWRGVLVAGRTMKAPWSWLAVAGGAIPSFIGDRIYDLVQQNRINWFGARETCLAPLPANRARFLT